ncbi:MAG: hypothetical protein Rubg2KO_06900 [Rubricoccaceae bacterium]
MGDTVGRYRIVGELGRGGMGVVYRAEDPQLERAVALKVLPAHLQRDTRAKERLMVEARAAAALDHPNVCTVYEVAEEPDGRAFIALACYDGQTLRERLQDGPLQLDDAVRIAREVAAGLAAAHDRGIVHRDLKPSNVFLCADGTTKILDFGIAKIEGVALTTPGATPGTVEYGAPETTRGQVDARSDVWSLGVVLYEMLTGRRPFDAPYEAAVLYAVLNEDPAPASTLAPSVPPELDAVVARCLEKDPDDRYPDAAALVQALAPEESRQPDDVTRSLRRAGRGALRRLRHSRVWQAGVAAAVILIGTVGFRLLFPSDASALPSEMLVAILPLEPRPDAPEDSAFAIGLADELASGLVQARGDANLSVIPLTEIESEQITSAREASLELGANVTLQGRLQRTGDEVSVVLNLVRADGERIIQIDSRTFSIGQTGNLPARVLREALSLLRLDGTEEEADAMEDEMATAGADPDAIQKYMVGLGFLRENQESGDLTGAIEMFRLATEIDSTFTAAYARLGEAYVLSWEGSPNPTFIREAEAATEAARRLDPDHLYTLTSQAALFTAKGEYPRAVSAANRAVELAPNSYEAWIVLGDAEARNGDTVGARAAFRRAIQLIPDRWTAHAKLGYSFYGTSELDSAKVQFARILNTAPRHYQALYMLGAIADGEEDTTKARTYLEKAAAVRPGFGVYTSLASVVYRDDNPEPSIRFLRQALSYDSTDHRTWSNLASAYSEQPGLEAKQEHSAALTRAAELAESQLIENPNNATVLAWLAGYHALLGNDSRARKTAASAARLAPDDVDVQFRVAFAYASIGDLDNALPAVLYLLDVNHRVDEIRTGRAFTLVRKLGPVMQRLADA